MVISKFVWVNDEAGSNVKSTFVGLRVVSIGTHGVPPFVEVPINKPPEEFWIEQDNRTELTFKKS